MGIITNWAQRKIKFVKVRRCRIILNLFVKAYMNVSLFYQSKLIRIIFALYNFMQWTIDLSRITYITHRGDGIYNWRCACRPTIISASLSVKLEPWRRFASSLLRSRRSRPGVKGQRYAWCYIAGHSSRRRRVYWFWNFKSFERGRKRTEIKTREDVYFF